ncbi:hypothetical protein M1B72_09085 [Geomonas paludis]|uniref:HhH-GPD domain-containing protein n=1 Tax=Geomonas paludis TaxID=2740185 RepID=A0ABY4LM45_9BACT|nr:hypothetical protein [Geomonas paludis]UPU37843.1 hypothetical protein M1B72_09085 [Geomonas paludis]
MEPITASYVKKYVSSWEARHDEWVRDYLAPLVGTSEKTMNGIRPVLKQRLQTDWRYSLAFFIDRTTYQSRSDLVNLRTATYLFEKIVSLPPDFSVRNMEQLVKTISEEKFNGLASHVRVKTDIERLDYAWRFLVPSEEKNFTAIVLGKVASEVELWRFLEQFPYVSRNKTAPFYMKFIAWLFDLDLAPITVDRHVVNALQVRDGRAVTDPAGYITRVAKDLMMPATLVETALYEESWLKANGTSKGTDIV